MFSNVKTSIRGSLLSVVHFQMMSLRNLGYGLCCHHRLSVVVVGSRPPSLRRSLASLDTEPPRVETTVESNGVCHVVLNRPDKLNAVDLAMFEAIAETAFQLRSDRSIRAVILSGKGRAFSTGLDVVSHPMHLLLDLSVRVPCTRLHSEQNYEFLRRTDFALSVFRLCCLPIFFYRKLC
jgi:Enoyl-CoA hydratase/isomerase